MIRVIEMRTFLRRTLLAWWMIPIAWPIMMVLGWLLFGDWEESLSISNDFAQIMWNGE